MAIRLTVDNMLQFCLLSEKRASLSGLNDMQLENEFGSALQFYKEAMFYDTIGGKEFK
jgi:hypothetical protein